MTILRVVGWVVLAIGLAACGGAGVAPVPAAVGSTSSYVTTPFDATALDALMAYNTAGQGLAAHGVNDASRPELAAYADALLTHIKTEMAALTALRNTYFADVPDTGGDGFEVLTIEVSSDSSLPFDLRLIDALLRHHELVLAVAQTTQAQANQPDLRLMAVEMIRQQQDHLAQLREWRAEWFPTAASADDY